MDMGRAYSAATRRYTSATICWDPFDVVKLLNKAVIDTIRWSKLSRHGLAMTARETTATPATVELGPVELASRGATNSKIRMINHRG